MGAKKESGKWTKAQMEEFVLENDRVLYGALKALYSCQTNDEQSDGSAKYHNNAGFNGVDSAFLSSVAEFLLHNGYLTKKQKLVTRKRIVKYMGQITNLANAQYEEKMAGI